MTPVVHFVFLVLLAILATGCNHDNDMQSVKDRPTPSLAAPSPLETTPPKNQELVWFPGWKQGQSMNTPRSGAAALEIGGVIHVIGGATGKKFNKTSEFSQIKDDGSLTPWQPGPSLNTERGFSSAIRFKNHVYIVAGAKGVNGQVLLDSVERSTIQPDGTLGDWTPEKHTLNNKRRCSKLVVFDNQIYAFGGFSGILLDSVERATIQPDGSLSAWELLNDTMNLPRYIHGINRVLDRVYVMGGHDKEKGIGIKAVEWSKEDHDGWLLPWKMAEPLQNGRYGLAAIQHGDYLYALGGLDGAAYLDSIEKTSIAKDGSISPWQYTTPLPMPLEGMNVVQAQNNLYIIGGSNLNGFSPEVVYASFNQQGDIGSWVTPTEAETGKANREKQQAQKQILPNEGKIAQHIKADRYSYVVVTRDDGMSAWLAGPATDLTVGTHIQFPDGVIMKNFWSKELKKDFPAVMFVGELRVINKDIREK